MYVALNMNPSLLGAGQVNDASGDQNNITDQNNLALSWALSNATDVSANSNVTAAQDFNSAMLAQALGRSTYGMSTTAASAAGQAGGAAASAIAGATPNSASLLQSLGMPQSFLGQNPYAGLHLPSAAASLISGMPGNPVAAAAAGASTNGASKSLPNGLSRTDCMMRAPTAAGQSTINLNDLRTRGPSPLASSVGGTDAGGGEMGSNSATAVGNKKAISHLVHMVCDDESLSDYQCLVRKQIEFFEATSEDVDSNAQGRNKQLVLGQVGIRCRHCSMLPPRRRTRGAMYYPAKLLGIYQAAQNLATSHLCEHCNKIPPELKNDLRILRERKSPAGGGKQYWGDGARALGVRESEQGYLCFVDPVQAFEKYQKQEAI
mmetsp:Transcript_6277/g.8874  ORF Transcript_6277/g.8874 Transcript_6277/m.8874 type:complete len:377 (-) Transcript_6277:160-1290(-)